MATANPEMAEFLTKRLYDLQDRKNQKDIATRAGYTNPNMITHIKNGASKLSLDRVVDFADALEVDPRALLKLAILQYVSPDHHEEIGGLLENVCSANELETLRFIREINGGEDIALNDRTRNALVKAYNDATDRPTQE